GGLIHTFMKDSFSWKWQLGCFLIPAIVYGVMFFGQKFPKSEASEKGMSLGEMLRDVGALGSAVIGFFAYLFFKDGLGPLVGGFSGNEAIANSLAWKISAAVV